VQIKLQFTAAISVPPVAEKNQSATFFFLNPIPTKRKIQKLRQSGLITHTYSLNVSDVNKTKFLRPKMKNGMKDCD